MNDFLKMMRDSMEENFESVSNDELQDAFIEANKRELFIPGQFIYKKKNSNYKFPLKNNPAVFVRYATKLERAMPFSRTGSLDECDCLVFAQVAEASCGPKAFQYFSVNSAYFTSKQQ